MQEFVRPEQGLQVEEVSSVKLLWVPFMIKKTHTGMVCVKTEQG